MKTIANGPDNQAEKHGTDLIQYLVERPKIGDFVVVHGCTRDPFKARVRSYYQRSDDSVLVTRYRTKEEWIVKWAHCSSENLTRQNRPRLQ